MGRFSRKILQAEPQFIHEGGSECIPISRDDPNVIYRTLENIKGRDETWKKSDKQHEQKCEAQRLMKGEPNSGHFTHLSIPFESSVPMKGVYICVSSISTPAHLIFTFFDSSLKKNSICYAFPDFSRENWFYLPADLPDVTKCKIDGKGKTTGYFQIKSLAFIRAATSEEAEREDRESRIAQQWSEAQPYSAEYINAGGMHDVPIPREDPTIVDPSSMTVEARDDSKSKGSSGYDVSAKTEKMLRGEGDVSVSTLSLSFSSPLTVKCALVCMHQDYGSPALLLTFTHSDGKHTSKKYEFAVSHDLFGWHSLPIDLCDVVMCEIKGKGMIWNTHSRVFNITSLVFTQDVTDVSDVPCPSLPSH
ncbi:hypothetical protein ADUPG1_007289, partial [Aduncisulcus paluster]